MENELIYVKSKHRIKKNWRPNIVKGIGRNKGSNVRQHSPGAFKATQR